MQQVASETAIGCVLFDADEVLQYPAPERIERLERALGVLPQPVERFLKEVSEAEHSTMTGELDVEQVLGRVLERWGAEAGKACRLCEWIASVTVDAEMLNLVARIRASGRICALATNQQRHRARFMAEVLGYAGAFDHSFYSCELGFAKPDSRYFGAVLERLRLAPERVLFFDDNVQNVEAAGAIGIHAEQFVNTRDGRAHEALERLLSDYGVVLAE